MFEKFLVLILVLYSFVVMGYVTEALTFEKIVRHSGDLWNLQSSYRIIHLIYDIMTPNEIFNNFTNIQLIITLDYYYVKTCDQLGTHIEQFDKSTFKIRYSDIKTVIDNSTSKLYDNRLQNCIEDYCGSANRGYYTLDCSKKRIKKLLVKYHKQLCYREIFDINFQSNDITTIKVQSFMKIFVYVVRLDLRNNPIFTFNSNAFKPMKMLRFLYVSYVNNVIDESAIRELIKFSIRLISIECYSEDIIQFYAWNSYCKNSTVDFFNNYGYLVRITTSKILEHNKTLRNVIAEKTTPILTTPDTTTETEVLEDTETDISTTSIKSEMVQNHTKNNSKWLLYTVGYASCLLILLLIYKICRKC